MEMLLLANSKKPTPKFIWELHLAAGAGNTFVRFNDYAAIARLNAASPPTACYDIATATYVSQLAFTNNLGIFGERYISSTKTDQPAVTRAWATTGSQSGNPTGSSYRLQLSGNPPNTFQTSAISGSPLTGRLYPGVTGTNGLTDVSGYLYGGLAGGVALNTMYKFTEAGITAFTYTGAPGVKQSQAMCHEATSGLWMFGGAKSGSNATNNNELWFMPEGTNAWELKTPTGVALPEVFNPGMVISNNKIYIFCGIDKAGGNTKATYIYDIATNNVSKMDGDFIGTSSNISHSFIYKNIIYTTASNGQVYKMGI